MGDDDAGAADLGEGRLDRHPQPGRVLDVNGGEGFVDQHCAGPGGQRPGQRDPRRLAAGEFTGPAGGEIGGIQALQHLQRQRPGLVAPEFLGAGPVGDVAQHVEVREQQRLLSEQTDAAPVGGHETAGVDQDLAVDVEAAAVGFQQPAQQVQQRRFPGPVRADHGQYPPRRHVQAGFVVAGIEGSLPVQSLHDLVLPFPYAITMTIPAKITSSSDKAMAASGSASRWR